MNKKGSSKQREESATSPEKSHKERSKKDKKVHHASDLEQRPYTIPIIPCFHPTIISLIGNEAARAKETQPPSVCWVPRKVELN